MPSRAARRVLLALALALAAGGCEDRPRDAPPVIFISLDTLRRDGLGPYRQGRPSVTPHLDAFAAGAAVFHDAYAQIPFTLPSHMSMFTGLQPDVHGVTKRTHRLDDMIPTLPQLLWTAGYATHGVVTNLLVSGRFGFARGFEGYHELDRGLTYAGRVVARTQAILSGLEAGRPVFLFLHFMDPHSDFSQLDANTLPYYSPRAYRRDLHADELGREFCDAADHCASAFLMVADREERAVSPRQLEQIARLYDAGLRYLDAELGRLFEMFERAGLYDDALIVLTSDHGEEFREHGQFLHAQAYTETAAVPLLIKFPGGAYAGRRVDGLVESVDLLPTVLDVLGLPVPAAVQGRSLLPLVRDGKPVREVALSREKPETGRYVLRTRHYTLVAQPGSERVELYDRADDPGERRDRSADQPERVRELRQRLEALWADNRRRARALAATPEAGGRVLTRQEEAELRSIGYLE